MATSKNLPSSSLEALLEKIQYTSVPKPTSSKRSKKKPTPSTAPDQRKKRNRITFDATQVDEMEKVFAENQYPDAVSRDELAKKIQLHEERVQIWFQNRRAKYRRELRHSYHPYESPKDEEYGIGKLKSIADVNNGSSVDVDSTTSDAKDDEEVGDSPISPNNLMKAVAVSVDLSSISSQSSQNSEDSNALNSEIFTSRSSPEFFENLNSDIEKAKLLMWTISSLFTVQAEIISS